MKRTTIFLPLASAALLTVALSAGPERGDNDLDGLLAKIGRLANEHDQRLLERLAREPGNETLYCMCAQPVYNAGKRELAISLLELGEQKAANPGRVRAALRAIYRYELDLDRLEKSYADELDQAIEAKREHLPQALLADAVMVDRLRPKYLGLYKEMTEYKRLFELLRQMCKEPAVREQLLRTRLAEFAGDDGTAGELLCLLAAQHRWKLLGEGGPDLPAPVREHPHYLYTKAQALLELGKKDEALAATDEAAKQLASYKWAWQQVAESYSKLDKGLKALEVVRTYAPQADHLTALALAKYGDSEGAEACVQQCIDRNAPAWVLFLCVDACRQAGLKKRAEEVFDVAEAKCLSELARDHRPAFNLPYEIRYRYEQEGRHARLIDKFAQAFAGRDRDIAMLLKSLCERLAVSGKRDEAAELARRYYRDKPSQPEFMLLCAVMLQRAGKHDQAGEILEQASTMPSDDRSGITPLGQLRMMHYARVCAAAKQEPPAATAPASPPPENQQTLAKLEELVKQAPKEGALRVRLGLALIKAGKIEDGRQEVRKGLELGCDFGLLPPFHELPSCRAELRVNPAGYGNVVSAYLEAGLSAELENDFLPLLSRTNAHRVAHLEVVARYLTDHGRAAEAAAIYLQLKDLDPYRARYFQERATASTQTQTPPA